MSQWTSLVFPHGLLSHDVLVEAGGHSGDYSVSEAGDRQDGCMGCPLLALSFWVRPLQSLCLLLADIFRLLGCERIGVSGRRAVKTWPLSRRGESIPGVESDFRAWSSAGCPQQGEPEPGSRGSVGNLNAGGSATPVILSEPQEKAFRFQRTLKATLPSCSEWVSWFLPNQSSLPKLTRKRPCSPGTNKAIPDCSSLTGNEQTSLGGMLGLGCS